MLVGRTKPIIQELALPSAIVRLIYNAGLASLRKNLQLVSGVEPENCSFIMESSPNRAMGDEEVLEWKRAVDRENKNYFQDNPVRQTYHR